MIKSSNTWREVEEKLEELRGIVEEKWDKGEWELAVLGESTIRTVEQSKVSAQEMRHHTNDYIKTLGTLRSKRQQH